MDSLVRCASKLSHSPDPDGSGPKGDPGTVFRVPDRRATAKAANEYSFAACRLLAVWDDVRTFLLG